MQHTCKSCGTRVKIPEEWILIGLDQRIKCQVCGNRVNLKIKEFVDKKNASTAKGKTPKGTIIIASKKETNTSYRLSITNDLNSLHKTHLLRDGKPQTLGAQEQVFIDISDIVKIGQNTLIGFSKSDF
mgnify:CR=1 FL=1